MIADKFPCGICQKSVAMKDKEVYGNIYYPN